MSEIPAKLLEKFNELFSGYTITLLEDIYNTFSSSSDKEIRNFSKRIKFFAACPQVAATKLSEAVLSKFTTVYIETYTEEEQKYVLSSYSNFKCLKFSEKEIQRTIYYGTLLKQRIHFYSSSND